MDLTEDLTPPATGQPRAIGFKQCQKCHLLTLSLQLLGHFEGYHTTQA